MPPRSQSTSGRRSRAALDLQQRIDAPIHQPELDATVGEGKLDYELYLRTTELLGLQTPSSDRVHRDELLFQIVHQIQELWLKQLAQELVHIVGALDTDTFHEARLAIERGVRVLSGLQQGIHVLDSLTPAAFQVIRRHLGEGSGLQSPSYAAVRLATKEVERSYLQLAERHGTTLEQVYADDDEAPELLWVFERLVDLDVEFQAWLVAHFQLVRRTIGVHREVAALDGYPTKALEVRMKRALFADLWAVRVTLTKAWKREGGFSPGEPRGTGRAMGE